MSVDVEELVSAYLAIRSERERILRQYEVEDADLKSDMAEIEAMMLAVCNDVNADSIKTQHGTVMRKLNERFFCNDWDGFRKFVLEHEAVELLEKRIHQGNFKQFISEHEGDGLPPGVNIMREYGISVRKSSNQ
mgnify:CR=1 FL=1|tara:strand:- start:95 stop:496 length:402 start_codon:yes stop_codon:yes gene_type:complete